jgi:hypothetical protein
MQHILQKTGFKPSLGYFPGQYEDKVEVWYRPVSTVAPDIPSAGSAGAGIS